MSGEIKCCPNDRDPLVWTFEYPGYEYICLTCGYKCGVFGLTAMRPATKTVAAKAAKNQRRYEVERAKREGREPPPEPDQSVPLPVCNGCGKTAEGPFDHSGKPRHWYSRTKDGVTDYACSRDCIPSREMVMPW